MPCGEDETRMDEHPAALLLRCKGEVYGRGELIPGISLASEDRQDFVRGLEFGQGLLFG
jgi:hypothetical protein